MTRSRLIAALAGLAAMGFALAAAAAPDATKGLEIFKVRCGICHSTDTTGGPVLGPNLRGVMGRKAASAPGFQLYSKAMASSNLTWDAASLDSFLTAPMTKVPGTTMPMALPDAGERADVIAFLESLKK